MSPVKRKKSRAEALALMHRVAKSAQRPPLKPDDYIFTASTDGGVLLDNPADVVTFERRCFYCLLVAPVMIDGAWVHPAKDGGPIPCARPR